VTGVAHKFKRHPKGTSAKDLYIENSPDDFLMTFGFPRRDIISDRNKMPTLSQALYLMNGYALKEDVESEENILGRLLAQGRDDLDIASKIYLTAYSRQPSDAEMKTLSRYLASEHSGTRGRRELLEDILWTVINTKEFQLNY